MGTTRKAAVAALVASLALVGCTSDGGTDAADQPSTTSGPEASDDGTCDREGASTPEAAVEDLVAASVALDVAGACSVALDGWNPTEADLENLNGLIEQAGQADLTASDIKSEQIGDRHLVVLTTGDSQFVQSFWVDNVGGQYFVLAGTAPDPAEQTEPTTAVS